MSAAPRVDTAPGQLRLRRVAFARLARIREEHVLPRRGSPAPAERWTPYREELLLNYVRQAEALGINVVRVLSDLLLAEDAVRAFEQKTGRALKRFVPISGGSARLTPEDWKSLDVLPEIIRTVSRALSCWRVLSTLEWLRSERAERAVGDLPPKLTPLLDEIGKKIARSSRWWNREQLEKQVEILNVWEARSSLISRDEREAAAAALGLGPENAWKTLAREARRLIAGNRREHENWRRRTEGG